MLHTYGECPLCINCRLHLNESDLMECPNCSLVFSAADPLAAAVMPFLGAGQFRIEDCNVECFQGSLVTKSLPGTVLPDYKQPFDSPDDLSSYRDSLVQPASSTYSNSLALSKRFLEAFRVSVVRCDPHRLARDWPSKPRRTRLYAEVTVPDIAADLSRGRDA